MTRLEQVGWAEVRMLEACVVAMRAERSWLDMVVVDHLQDIVHKRDDLILLEQARLA